MAEKNVSVRFPDELHTRIKQAAKTNHRSFNSEVLALSEQGLSVTEQAGPCSVDLPTVALHDHPGTVSCQLRHGHAGNHENGVTRWRDLSPAATCLCTGSGWPHVPSSASCTPPEPAAEQQDSLLSQRIRALIFNGITHASSMAAHEHDWIRLSERSRIADAVYSELAAGGIEFRLGGLALLAQVAGEPASSNSAPKSTGGA